MSRGFPVFGRALEFGSGAADAPAALEFAIDGELPGTGAPPELELLDVVAGGAEELELPAVPLPEPHAASSSDPAAPTAKTLILISTMHLFPFGSEPFDGEHYGLLPLTP